MSNFARPAHLNASLNNSSHTHGASQPITPLQGVGMVHTPYSCAHDLVPEGSEVASQMGQWPEAFGSSSHSEYHYNAAPQFSRNNSNQSMMNSTSGGNNSFSRPSTTSPQPAENLYYSQQQQSQGRDPWAVGQCDHTGKSLDCSSDSSQGCSRTSSYNTRQHQQQQYQQAPSARQDTAQFCEQQQSQQQANGNYPAFMMRAPIVNGPVHASHLGGKTEYLEMPAHGAEITQAAQWHRNHKVFIGHVKFEISADGLRWLIYMLTGVQAGKVEVRGMGCFMVFFGSAEEVFRVRGLHKRVLFDTQGVWFAQSLEQEEVLHHYATNVAPSVHAKLPKGLLVVDEETSRRRNRKQQPKTQQQPSPTQQPFAAPAASGFQSHATADQLWSASQ